MSSSASKLVILDRDGVINYDSDQYIKSAEEWIPLPGSLEAIAELNQAGFLVTVATNQSGLARGLFTINDLHTMHQKMMDLLAPMGGHVDGIFFCPHVDADRCDCRKPLPGLMRDIASRYRKTDSALALIGVPIVGDSLRDLEAATALGASPHLVLTGKGQKTVDAGIVPAGTVVHADLMAFTKSLLGSASNI
jgi:D-glycero-D-manno-heptose 1,7-bisphosphate phosphatase